MREKFPILRRLQLIFFRICNVGAIAGLGVAVVLLLMRSMEGGCESSLASMFAGVISLAAIWLFSERIDKIKNDW